jgi:hypothetical protein
MTFAALWIGLLISVQPSPDSRDPYMEALRGLYGYIRTMVVESARLMPSEHYDFRPTPEVRSFGEIIGHVAFEQYRMCSVASGEPNPVTDAIEKTRGKDALVKAIEDAGAYCASAYAKVTDGTGAERMTLGADSGPRAGVLMLNVAHTNEHYGNLVTYMRLKGLVPPSSRPR